MGTAEPGRVTVTPAVLRKLKVEEAKSWMGRKWVLHEANQVQRKRVRPPVLRVRP